MTPSIANRTVGATGYGLMGLSWRPRPQPIEDSIKVMKAALERGANFWNGGTFYGTPEYNSLHVLKAYFTKYPADASKVVISIKGAYNSQTHAIDGSKENVKKDIEAILAALDGTCFVSVYEPARVDPKVPIEETVAAAAEFVRAGKIGGVGLSECGSGTIERAMKVTTIASVEVEFSLFSTDIVSNGVAKTCADLKIPIVAYSPLSRGFLTGDLRSHDDLAEDDARRNFPRFSAENFDKNLVLLHEVEKLAEQKGATAGNVAIAWVKQHSNRDGCGTIIPIPGTTTVKRLDENMADISLTEEEFLTLNKAVEDCEVVGRRYPEYHAPLEFA